MAINHSIQLNPGHSGYISIQDTKEQEIYRKNVEKESEIRDFIAEYGKTFLGYGVFPTIFCPLKLKGKEFAKDFFCPTLMNFAIKVNRIGLRVFACIWAVVVDILTFIPRALIGTPCRAHYLKKHPEKIHPLIDLIKANPESQFSMKSGKVILKTHFEKIKIDDPLENGSQTADKIEFNETISIAIKKLHMHRSSWKKVTLSTFYERSGVHKEWSENFGGKREVSHKIVSL